MYEESKKELVNAQKNNCFKNTVHLIVKDPMKLFGEYRIDAFPFETGRGMTTCFKQPSLQFQYQWEEHSNSRASDWTKIDSAG